MTSTRPGTLPEIGIASVATHQIVMPIDAAITIARNSVRAFRILERDRITIAR